MSIVDDAGTAGKDTDPTPASPSDSFAEILLLLRGIGTRLDVLEQRFEYLDRDVLKAIDAESEAVTDAEPEPPRVPSLAFTSDGRVLLSVAYVQGAHIDARETWTGLVLSEAEACDVLDMLGDGADDAAAHAGGAIIARSKKDRGGSDE